MPRHSFKRKTYSNTVKRQAVHDVVIKHCTQRSVAQRFHCSPNTIINWIKQFRNEITREAEPPAFAPIEVCSAPEPRSTFELSTPSGLTLRLPATISSAQLIDILNSLESRQC
jgi:transposase-like protein